jgi:hypothetical protein
MKPEQLTITNPQFLPDFNAKEINKLKKMVTSTHDGTLKRSEGQYVMLCDRNRRSVETNIQLSLTV